MGHQQTKQVNKAVKVAVAAHDDDQPVGRILNRRELLALLGAAGSTLLVGAGFQAVFAETIYLPIITNGPAATATPTLTATSVATATPTPTATAGVTPTATALPACVVSPALTEGPYFVDEQLNRSDIRLDPSDNTLRAGTQLELTLQVYQISSGSCSPLAGAIVDIWHCDGTGLYSDVQSEGTAGQKFLRGYQVSDTSGRVNFTTIYPGWYTGRAVHIHFKVRAALTNKPAYEFTSQFFFDDTMSDQVHSLQPYAAKGTRDTRNSQDNIYQGGGSQLLLDLTASGNGYATTFAIGMVL